MDAVWVRIQMTQSIPSPYYQPASLTGESHIQEHYCDGTKFRLGSTVLSIVCGVQTCWLCGQFVLRRYRARRFPLALKIHYMAFYFRFHAGWGSLVREDSRVLSCIFRNEFLNMKWIEWIWMNVYEWIWFWCGTTLRTSDFLKARNPLWTRWWQKSHQKRHTYTQMNVYGEMRLHTTRWYTDTQLHGHCYNNSRPIKSPGLATSSNAEVYGRADCEDLPPVQQVLFGMLDEENVFVNCEILGLLIISTNSIFLDEYFLLDQAASSRITVPHYGERCNGNGLQFGSFGIICRATILCFTGINFRSTLWFKILICKAGWPEGCCYHRRFFCSQCETVVCHQMLIIYPV